MDLEKKEEVTLTLQQKLDKAYKAGYDAALNNMHNDARDNGKCSVCNSNLIKERKLDYNKILFMYELGYLHKHFKLKWVHHNLATQLIKHFWKGSHVTGYADSKHWGFIESSTSERRTNSLDVKSEYVPSGSWRLLPEGSKFLSGNGYKVPNAVQFIHDKVELVGDLISVTQVKGRVKGNVNIGEIAHHYSNRDKDEVQMVINNWNKIHKTKINK